MAPMAVHRYFIMSIHFRLFLIVACLVQGIFALTVGNIQNARIHVSKRDVLQDVVSWDEHSILVRGERIMVYSGEFHPFRLPSPGLWLDVFQKIKAMGFSGVSFYTYWGLLEGNPGELITNGVFSLDEFFDAAMEAGIYLIARPGPYINAETAAGGIPGWVLKIRGIIRSTDQDYLDSTQNYASTIGKIIARAQITNGGPVIMVQPENEYSSWPGVTNFPSQMNKDYMAFVEQQLLDAGIVVPFIVNDNLNIGNFAPGSGLAEVNIYGIDAYPMRYDCGDPYIWPTYRFPKTWEMTHANYSPSTPFAVAEFQGGGGDGWGGVGEDRCAILTNNDAIKVQFKNTYSFAVTIFNVYMIYGGTNWGNLGYHGGYTSYDYGASITEDRQIWREKYSEMKLEANFLKASAAYLTTTAGHGANGSYGVPAEIAVTPLFSAINETNGTRTNFYVVRHANFTSLARTLYNLTVTTSRGNITIPQIGGSLVMIGRDSKIHVTDYDIGGLHMIYSSAEIFTWAKSSNSGRVLVLYGGNGEINEAAFPTSFGVPEVIEGHGVDIQRLGGSWVLQWAVESERRVVQIGKLRIYLLWRNEAYNYWSLELEAPQPVGNHTSPSKSSVIINGGYLLRTASIEDKQLKLTGDINATTNFEVISTPTEVTSVFFNNKQLHTTKSKNGNLHGAVSFSPPSITLPDFKTQSWHYIDSLPELQPIYDDTRWTSLDHTTTNNTLNLTTPTSMYASDYGYHTGSLIYRGRFLSSGNEATLFINTTGGAGFAHSIWLNSTFLGSWIGSGGNQTYAQTFTLPSALEAGKNYVFTILIDHMGQDEEAPGTDAIKFPRGILDYSLSSHPQGDIVWKMTGNLGGEQYIDKTRGPRNEGAIFAERQGYHLQNPPSGEWDVKNPVEDGVESAGVGFFTTTFDLHVPEGWDVPMGFVFNGTTGEEGNGGNYRVQLFVNGWQFGKYVNNLGPQTNFPIPEGILNHNGTNTVALTLWSLDSNGAKIGGFELVPNAKIWSGYRKPALVEGETWSERMGAY
ncbi:d050c883-7502-4bd3-b503-f4eb7cc8b717 [Sclerotinia trifoliorum]|uniref:Beta-galactosidase n=1 Tax=Sclerotinia trifoliorum TaxID=28548 RepID=A0A8H2ZLI4_9HELO|nr:d050c883-7502-4bd3-b503-f4eb7cc8b717 [Sclerotinia trifoliorum]